MLRVGFEVVATGIWCFIQFWFGLGKQSQTLCEGLYYRFFNQQRLQSRQFSNTSPATSSLRCSKSASTGQVFEQKGGASTAVAQSPAPTWRTSRSRRRALADTLPAIVQTFNIPTNTNIHQAHPPKF